MFSLHVEWGLKKIFKVAGHRKYANQHNDKLQ